MIASGLCLRSDHRYQKDWSHVNWNKRHYDNESKQRTLDFGEKGQGLISYYSSFTITFFDKSLNKKQATFVSDIL